MPTAICTGPHHGSGLHCPQYFIPETNSKPALRSPASAKASLKTTGNLLPLGAELGSDTITVWRTGQAQRLIQYTRHKEINDPRSMVRSYKKTKQKKESPTSEK